MSQEKTPMAVRDAAIVRTGIVGIAANVALAAFKAAVGMATNSIAIVLDAVNNFSDAGSSIITIIGTKLAGKQPDHNHPYGHGRAEYLTTMVVAAAVLWAGLTSLFEAVQSILHPSTPSYTTVAFVIVAVAVGVKLLLGQYTKAQGRRLDAASLTAFGNDATTDAAISASTLVAAGIYLATGVQLEGWLGVLISALIIKSGIDILRDALSKVLGERIDRETAQAVKREVCSVEGVRGAYDLVLNDYGPQRLQGSVHVEVDENLTARDIDRLTRHVQAAVMVGTGVTLHTVGIYSSNLSAATTAGKMRAALDQIVEREEHVLQAHGLYTDDQARDATFDLVVSFAAPDRPAVVDGVVAQMRERFPGYRIVASLDADTSD